MNFQGFYSCGFDISGDKRGTKADQLHLTALAPPPHTHRHRYFGVLAPNSPLREAVTAMAQGAPAPSAAAQAESASTALGTSAPALTLPGNAVTPKPDPVPPKRPAHYRLVAQGWLCAI